MNIAGLTLLAKRWERHAATRRWLAALTAGAVATALAAWWAPWAGAAAGIVVALVVWGSAQRRASRVKPADVAAHLDRVYPELEHSASLWLREPAESTLVERLQRRRLDAAWQARSDHRASLPSPRTVVRLGAACVVALAVAGVSWRGHRPPERSGTSTVKDSPAPSRPQVSAAPGLLEARLTILPPAYLRRPAREVGGLDAEVEDGSVVKWRLRLTEAGRGAEIVKSGGAGERVKAAVGDDRVVELEAVVGGTWLYQVGVFGEGGRAVTLPEVHVLKVIPDQPPRIVIQEPAVARTIVEPGTATTAVEVRIVVSDDHGVSSAALVATVAKGTGEAVKFREQVLALTPGAESAAGRVFSRTLDLAALGLEPGDELYFHATAKDNRAPVAQEARSETRFIVLRGPATELAEPGAAMAGVNRLPQYFRSQRQLIMDTERLLAERPALSEEQFRRRSEDIGVDQKLLRLRYGQFLGEEFEAEPGAARSAPGGTPTAGPREGEDRTPPMQRLFKLRQELAHGGHDHEGGNGTAYEREGRPPTAEELRAPFVHNHDSTEAATLFDHAVKATLRDVLAAMWEAEGLLRTVRPAEALPVENRALELLKELQQADRVYVRRVGFEPTPIKVDERRLRGELDAIPARASGSIEKREPDAEQGRVRAALTAISEAPDRLLAPELQTEVERLLLAAAETDPVALLPALAAWRKPPESRTAEERRDLIRGLWRLGGDVHALPERPRETGPAGLGERYRAALSAGEAGR